MRIHVIAEVQGNIPLSRDGSVIGPCWETTDLIFRWPHTAVPRAGETVQLHEFVRGLMMATLCVRGVAWHSDGPTLYGFITPFGSL